jgi:hypothetical protein
VNDQDDLEESEDFQSLEDRIRRGPLLGVLVWAALSEGAVWVVLNAIVQIRLATGYPDVFSSEVGAELWAWAQAVSGIAYTAFLVALGSYVLLWLRVRQGSGSHP